MSTATENCRQKHAAKGLLILSKHSNSHAAAIINVKHKVPFYIVLLSSISLYLQQECETNVVVETGILGQKQFVGIGGHY